MDELDELLAESARLPRGRDQVEVLQRAADLADSLGDLDRAFDIRLDLVEATYVTEQAILGLSTYAWLIARLDAEPERFEHRRQSLGWVAKWMPGYARKHPKVPAERLIALVDDLERRHVAEGSGRRQAIAVRMRLVLEAGLGPDLEELLVDWRASARTSLTDCAMCEADLEADVLLALGRRDEALLVLDPVLRGEIPSCAGGPSAMFRLGITLLVEEGRLEEARGLFGAILRGADVGGESRDLSDVAGCAVLLARTGDVIAARRTALSVVPVLGRAGNDSDEMWMAAELARALMPADGAEGLLSLTIDVLDEAPAGGWTVATLRDALAGHALSLAARFDERNGNAVVSSQIQELLLRPDLPHVSLRGTDRPAVPAADAQVGSNGSGAAAGHAVAEEPAIVTGPTRPVPDPKEGAEALDHWVREQFESWRADTTRDVLRERYAASSDDPLLAATVLSWLLGTDEVADLERAASLVEDDRLPGVLRARLAAVLARTHLDAGDVDVVPALVDRARSLVEAGDIEAVAGMRILRNLSEASVGLGDHDGADHALALSSTLDLADPLAGFLLDAARLVAANARRAASADDDPEAAEAAARVASVHALDVLESADDLPADGVINPLTVVAVLDATSTLMELADDAPPHEPLERAIEGVPVQVDTAGLRAQAFLLLADLHLRLDGPAAAMIRQRRAVEAVERVGPPGLSGWTRRGLALQLHHLGRFDEALVQYAMAVDLLRAGDDVVNAWMVEAARARCLLDAADPNRAANVAGDVLAEVDEAEGLPDELRDMVVEPALDVAIDAEVQAGANHRATRLLTRFAELLERTDRPSVPAWTMGALCAARAGNVERAEQMFARGEEAANPDPGPARDLDLAIVGARRAEMLWQLDRNEEAVGVAADAAALARPAGDPHLAAVAVGIGARAEHDEFARLLHLADPGARAQGERAVDALVAAIQEVQVAELDDLAAHLGERLEHARHELDELAGPT